MKTLTALLFLSIFFISCAKDRLTASGDKAAETRDLKDFSGVDSDGSTDVHISYGTEFKVTLNGSNNLLPYFKTEVIGSTLHVGYKNANVQKDDIQVYVTLPVINYISVSGSGDVDINGQFPQFSTFRLSISGSGEVETEDVLNVNEAVVKISGSGEANLNKMQSKNAEISISGSGDAKISVSDNLKARISGSGKIYYTGTAAVDADVSGSGKVIKF